LTTTDPIGDRWAAAGPPAEDIAYRTQTLKFTGIELALDESVSARTILRLWLYAFAASTLVFMVFVFLALIAAIGGSGSSSTSSFDGSSSVSLGAAGALVQIGGFLSFAVFWVVLLLVKIDEPVAEWKTLIEGKSAAAESSYAAIYHSLARRRIPLGVSPRRIRSDIMAESVNNRLIITERAYVAYVSVFAFGTSLYVGWMMWRNRRGVTLIIQFVKDLFGGLLGRTGIVNQMLRTERVRAMREAVHSAVREGVDAAVEDVSMPIAATFGYEIPIESISAASAGPALVPGRPAQPNGQPAQPNGQPPGGDVYGRHAG